VARAALAALASKPLTQQDRRRSSGKIEGEKKKVQRGRPSHRWFKQGGEWTRHEVGAFHQHRHPSLVPPRPPLPPLTTITSDVDLVVLHMRSVMTMFCAPPPPPHLPPIRCDSQQKDLWDWATAWCGQTVRFVPPRQRDDDCPCARAREFASAKFSFVVRDLVVVVVVVVVLRLMSKRGVVRTLVSMPAWIRLSISSNSFIQGEVVL